MNDARGQQYEQLIRAHVAELFADGEPEVGVPETSTFSVGPGILAQMQAHGDSPATDEIYVKSANKDAYSHAYGRSGALYVYLFATNAVHRYDPAA